MHRSENINLTVTSYALLGLPGHFVNGVMDAGREFRLLRAADRSEVANNWSPAGAGTLRAHGIFHTVSMRSPLVPLAPALWIEPGRRYVLGLKFRTPPFAGVLVLDGDHFRREYPLPSAGEARGFGMKAGNDPSIALWTTNPEGTEIRLSLVGLSGPGAFAEFELREVDTGSFPVELGEFLPLSGRVRASEPVWLETPRRFIPGYEAAIDGRKARVANSPEGSVMIETPAGEHEFRLSYAGTPLLRAAFWTSFLTGWALALCVLGWLASRAISQLRKVPAPGGAETPVIPAPPRARA